MALATICARNGHSVQMTTRDETVCAAINSTHVNPKRMSEFKLHPRIKATTDFVTAISNCDMLIHCIPAQTTFSFIQKYKDIIKSDTPLVSTSKGIYVPTQQLMRYCLSGTPL